MFIITENLVADHHERATHTNIIGYFCASPTSTDLYQTKVNETRLSVLKFNLRTVQADRGY